MTNFKALSDRLKARANQTMSLEEYLEEAKTNPELYRSPAGRMLKAIGTPELVDTSQDSRLRIIHENRTIKVYPAFQNHIYGNESVIERLVSYFTHAEQGLEEAKQVLYFRGPVGSAKSTFAELCKKLMEQEPIYVLALDGELSPVLDSPLCLFPEDMADDLNIPSRFLKVIPSPWAVKRLDQLRMAGKDISDFSVVKMYPDQLRQIAISKTEPGDENNQDISTLVGKTNLRMLDKFNQSDSDSYDFSGALNRANQGMMEFVEMFKAPIKTLHPLLTATQEGNYKGTEALGAIPFSGIILAHSNDTEWSAFRNDKKNEAFLDRIYVIPVPYNLRVKEEVQIYDKLIRNSTLKDAPIAPGTLDALAEFAVLSRIEAPDNSNVITKMQVYDGRSVRDKDPRAKTINEYQKSVKKKEGFEGISTRFAYKVLSATFNFDATEIAANPVHLLMQVLPKAIKQEGLPKEVEEGYLATIQSYLVPELTDQLEEDINSAYIDSYEEYGQNIFDRYITYADCFQQRVDFKDPDTGHIYNEKALDKELAAMEIKAKISNPLEFRAEVVSFCLRYQAKHGGKNPDWKAYEPIRRVIDGSMKDKLEDLLPVISTGSKASKEDQKKHSGFVKRMVEKGYTEKQVRLMVDFYKQARISTK